MLKKLKTFIFMLLLILPLTGCQQTIVEYQFAKQSKNFLEKFEQCESYTFDIDVQLIEDGNVYKSSNSYRVLKNPMIIEEILEDNKFKQTTGYIQQEDKLYFYKYNDRLTLEEVIDKSTVNFEQPELKSTNPSEVEVTKKNNSFSFITTIEDYMGEEKALEFFDLFNHISRKDFLNTPTTITSTFNKNSFITEVDFKIKIANKTTKYYNKMSINLERLDKFNFFYYTWFLPKPISSNTKQLKVNEPITFDSSSFLVKASLEPGSYRIIDSYNEPLNTFVYKSTLSLTEYSSALLDIYSSNIFLFNLLEGHFTIEEEGEYYICIYSSSSETTAKLIKNNYTTVLNFSDEKEFKSNSVTLEGLYDYDYYVYESSKQNEILEIKNIGTNPITFYINEDVFSIESNKSTYYPITKSKNPVFFYSNSDEDTSITYQFEVISHQDKNGLQVNYDDLDLLTLEYTLNSYFLGSNLPSKKLRLEIKEDGKYEIESLENKHYSIQIINYDTKEVIRENFVFNLKAGKYEVIISSNYSGAHLDKFRCVKI